MKVKELEEFLENIIEGFNKQEENIGKAFSEYGKGVRDAYKQTLCLIQDSGESAKDG